MVLLDLGGGFGGLPDVGDYFGGFTGFGGLSVVVLLDSGG